MKKINHKELKQIAYHYGNVGKPIIVLGRTGIGKSCAIRDAEKKVAEEMGKEFVEWNGLNSEEKDKVMADPDKYYVFVVLLLSQMAPEDIKGLPDMNLRKFVEWRVNMWTEVLRICDGSLFLDEINLVSPSIQATVYQVLLDKQVGETPLKKTTRVYGAGNLTEDRAGVYELAKPIRTRVGMYELAVPDKESLTNYATANGWNGFVISFINKFESKIFVEDENTDDVITPRGWEFVSELIQDKTDMDEIELYSSGILGEAVGIEFTSFIRLMDKIPSPEELLSKKKKIPQEIDLKYACIASIVEHFRSKKDKDRVSTIKKFIDLKNSLEPEYYVLALRMMKGIQDDILRKIIKEPQFNKIMEYKKYLVDGE